MFEKLSGVQSFAFSELANFSSATAPSGFTFEAGGLNSSGCNGSGNFFCLSGSTPSGPALAANSVLDFVFDVTLYPWHQASALACRFAGAKADQSRCHRAGQQARPNGLGVMAKGERYKQPAALAA